ncbi:hypothetical protein RCL1_000497 [Eukaryota sp. TZLM3-RCL]
MSSCDCSQLKYRLSKLENTVSHQKNLSITVNQKLNDISSTTKTHFSTLSDRIHALEALVLNQNAEISHLRSHYDSQLQVAHTKIHQLESKLSQTSLLLLDQSNLIDQFKELLPLISHIKAYGEEKHCIEKEQRLCEIQRRDEENTRQLAEEERRIEQQKQNEFKANPIAFICNFPSEVYSIFGNRTKFIGETKGSCLELSNDDCLVRSTNSCRENSFIAINHPLNGRITLTLRSTGSDGCCSSNVGYFNPNKCQDDDSYKHFTGINVYTHGLYFFHISGTRQANVTSKLSPNQSIIISFTNNKVTYSTPHSGWSRTVECVDGWVFGIDIGYNGESWSIE